MMSITDLRTDELDRVIELALEEEPISINFRNVLPEEDLIEVEVHLVGVEEVAVNYSWETGSAAKFDPESIECQVSTHPAGCWHPAEPSKEVFRQVVDDAREKHQMIFGGWSDDRIRNSFTVGDEVLEMIGGDQ
jgi:hypothetical protein